MFTWLFILFFLIVEALNVYICIYETFGFFFEFYHYLKTFVDYIIQILEKNLIQYVLCKQKTDLKLLFLDFCKLKHVSKFQIHILFGRFNEITTWIYFKNEFQNRSNIWYTKLLRKNKINILKLIKSINFFYTCIFRALNWSKIVKEKFSFNAFQILTAVFSK